MKIPVIGTIFTDIKGHPFETFIPDGRNAGYIETVHGGVGRNIAEDLAVLGAQPVFVSLVTPGGTGDEIVSHLQETGVDTSCLRRAANGSGTWLAIFDENGDVVSSISVRAELAELPAALDENRSDIFTGADWTILEIDIDTPSVERVFRYAKEYGSKVCCAVATMSHALDKREYLKKADLFICNLQEAGMLFEEDLAGCSPEELAAALPAKMRAFGIRNMIVTMSSEGSVYASVEDVCAGSSDSALPLPADNAVADPAAECNVNSSKSILSGICPAEKAVVIDSTGAGDSYCAGVVFALCRGSSPEEACAFGAKVSARVVASEKNVLSSR